MTLSHVIPLQLEMHFFTHHGHANDSLMPLSHSDVTKGTL